MLCFVGLAYDTCHSTELLCLPLQCRFRSIRLKSVVCMCSSDLQNVSCNSPVLLAQGYFLMDMWGETQASFDATQGTCALMSGVYLPVIASFKGASSQVVTFSSLHRQQCLFSLIVYQLDYSKRRGLRFVQLSKELTSPYRTQELMPCRQSC